MSKVQPVEQPLDTADQPPDTAIQLTMVAEGDQEILQAKGPAQARRCPLRNRRLPGDWWASSAAANVVCANVPSTMMKRYLPLMLPNGSKP
jgi:hypothetical protein